jgi:aryl-alcohol dehydrogenase-like predicted oxidoreductase
MNYRTLGRTGLKVSELCLGTMTFGWGADKATSHAMLDEAFEAGITFFDTADIYSFWAEDNDGGVSEAWIGEWLRDHRRREVIIATKVRGRMWEGPNGEGLSRHHIINAVEDSLRRLQTDVIDLYQVHWPDEDTPLEETLRAFDDLITAGKVRYIGCSNYPAWLLTKSLWVSDVQGLCRFESLQPHYSLVHREEFERELRDLCQDQDIGIIPYSPLGRGFLTGKYRPDTIPQGSRGASDDSVTRYFTEENFALLRRMDEVADAHEKTVTQVALGWLLSQEVITAPIIGARTLEQLTESIGAAGLRLSPNECTYLENGETNPYIS